MLRGRGTVIESDEIQFEGVPIVSPNGDILVKSLSFFVQPGVSLIRASIIIARLMSSYYCTAPLVDCGPERYAHFVLES